MSSNLSNVEILNILLEGKNLDDSNSKLLMQRWLNDEISDVQTGAFLGALRAKGCTGIELSSMAEELLSVCKIPVSRPNLYMVDTCGTGGDGANTFNISTAVAFVAASCGVKIAKHGNKSARTVFNQLGPLVNPLRPNAQVLGVASEDLLEPMGSALLNMGMDRAIVVHGAGGLDEAALQGENKLVFVRNGELQFSKINISDFNHENISNDKLVVSDVDSNEEILMSVLNGSGQKFHKMVVALNAALVLWAAGNEDNLHEGFNKALVSINEGNPWEYFLRLKTYLSGD